MAERPNPDSHRQLLPMSLALVALSVGLLLFPLVVRFDLTGAVQRMELGDARIPLITRLALTSWAAPIASCTCVVCLLLGVRNARAWLWLGLAFGSVALGSLTYGLLAPL